jgi:glucose-6-phosphate 1-dehydrogenase
MTKIPPGVGPQHPQVVVLFGATGDLAGRKLLPGLFHLSSSGFIPGCRIIGVSLDELDTGAFRKLAREALTEFATREVRPADWDLFASNLHYLPLTAGGGSPAVRFYDPGTWGPTAIHQLIAPHAWRLPFERGWRHPDTLAS